MYDDWSDIDLSWSEKSVLDRFLPTVSRTVAVAVVDDLARQLSAQSCSLTNDVDLCWCMQVLCYGLGLPFSSDYVTVRNVVKIYGEWLTCLTDEPSVVVPRPLLEQPSKYARDIIDHLHRLFIPRSESGSDVILRQAKECHYVLRCLHTVIIRCKASIKDEMWPEVLRFLLSINDSLLSPPYEPDDISDHLCARTLSTLFDLWISACFNGQFPSPSFWKTFRSLCHNWRHRIALVDQWARSCFILSSMQLNCLYGPNYCKMKLATDDQKLVPSGADPMLVAQTWFRIFHLIGNPVEILNTHNFDTSPKFREYIGSKSGENGIIEPSQHPCLHHLPYCFFRAVSCVNSLVSSFLGEDVDCTLRKPESTASDPLALHATQSVAPQQQLAPTVVRRVGNTNKAKELRSHSVFVGKSVTAVAAFTQSPDSVLITNAFKSSPLKYRMNITYANCKPSVDSLLRLFGDWLFTCAAVKHADQKRLVQEDTWSQKSLGSQFSTSDGGGDTTSAAALSKSSSQSELNRLSSDSLGGIPGMYAGKAEAAAALCKVFCSRTFSEKISDNYVAKFCTILLDLLSHDDCVVHAAVIFNGVNIFRIGIHGTELLVPYFLDCIDRFFTDPDRMRAHPSISEVDLRRASLDLLASIIVYPTHFGTTAFSDVNRNSEHYTFIGFRSRILRILFATLKFEADTINIQIALSLVCLFYQSCCLYEHNAETLQNMNYVKEMQKSIFALLSDSLCGKWASDYAVCLAGFDCLIALSDVGGHDQNIHDLAVFERVIISLCRFIEVQLSRPPPAHSRDLHSVVVAAFNCLECWIIAYPFILRYEHCLNDITETIQLGITGAKPQSKEQDATDVKKPASQRVHDAAEQLLHTMFCKAGAPFSIHEPMEDEAFVAKSLGFASNNARGEWRSRFLYALLDNMCLLAVAETEVAHENDEKVPAAAVVLRSPYAAVSGWIFTLETQQKGKNTPGKTSRREGIDVSSRKYQAPICIPPDVEKFGKCKADASFPPLILRPEAERLMNHVNNVKKEVKWLDLKKDSKNEKLNAKPPTRDTVVRTARLLLQDLGYLEHDAAESKFRLLSYGSDLDKFLDDLKSVDQCPSRYIHTAHIFYVRNGKTNLEDILTNGSRLDRTATCFRKFLAALGVAIDIGQDHVWTGHWKTAYKDDVHCDLENRTIDGTSHALYWASPLAEIAFVMPSTASFALKQKVTEKPCDNVFVDQRMVSSLDTNTINNVETGSTSVKWRAHSFDQLLVEVQENDEGYDDECDSANPPSTASTTKGHGTYFSPPHSPTFQRRPAGRLRTLFFGRRRQTLSAAEHSASGVSTGTPNADGGPVVPCDSVQSRPPPPPPPRSKSICVQELESAKVSLANTGTKLRKTSTYQDYRFLIVWLEKFEDQSVVNIDELASLTDLGETGQQCSENQRYVMFICPYENGLYRIKFFAQWSKLGCPAPLIDGVVISEDILSLTTRETVLSVGTRRRLEQEGYVSPFVKRRQKINEFASKYSMKLSPAETFYTLLMR